MLVPYMAVQCLKRGDEAGKVAGIAEAANQHRHAPARQDEDHERTEQCRLGAGWRPTVGRAIERGDHFLEIGDAAEGALDAPPEAQRRETREPLRGVENELVAGHSARYGDATT